MSWIGEGWEGVAPEEEGEDEGVPVGGGVAEGREAGEAEGAGRVVVAGAKGGTQWGAWTACDSGKSGCVLNAHECSVGVSQRLSWRSLSSGRLLCFWWSAVL